MGGRGAVTTTKAKIVRSVNLGSQRFESSIRSASFVQRAFPSSGDSSGRTSAGQSKEDLSSEQLSFPVPGDDAGDSSPELSPSRPVMLSDIFAATRVARQAQESTNQNNSKKSAVARITAVLVALPLSKLKIVIGENVDP